MAAGRLCTAGALAGGGVRYKKGNSYVCLPTEKQNLVQPELCEKLFVVTQKYGTYNK